MANVEFTSVEADQNCINPTLSFRLSIQADNLVSYASVQSGRLLTNSGSVLGYVSNDILGRDSQSPLEFLQAVDVSDRLGKPEHRKTQYVKLAVQLTPAAVARIERDRHKAHHKTVGLRLELELMSIVARMNQLPANQIPGLAHRPRLSFNLETSSHTIEIPHSEWVNNFCPHLGVGNFLLLELHQPTIDNVSEQWSHVYTVIKQRLLEMEINLRKGEWKSVMVDARQVFEDIKVFGGRAADRPFHDDFKNAFKVANHSNSGIEQLEKGIKALFDFCSKYIHTKDHDGNPQPCPTATKEDAEFVYALLVSFVSLLGSKLQLLA